MKLTYQQFKEALIKSGCFYYDDVLGIQSYCKNDYYIEDDIVRLLDAINEVLEDKHAKRNF